MRVDSRPKCLGLKRRGTNHFALLKAGFQAQVRQDNCPQGSIKPLFKLPAKVAARVVDKNVDQHLGLDGEQFGIALGSFHGLATEPMARDRRMAAEARLSAKATLASFSTRDSSRRIAIAK